MKLLLHQFKARTRRLLKVNSSRARNMDSERLAGTVVIWAIVPIGPTLTKWKFL